ncbi:MAG: phosphatidate cytidylyltransferase [Micrococcaceae bacterium]
MNLSEKSGRNMPVAVATGVALLAIALVPLIFNPWLFAIIVSVFAGFGTFEIANVLNKTRTVKLPAELLGALAFAIAEIGFINNSGFYIIFTILVVAFLVTNIPSIKANRDGRLWCLTAILVYVPGLLGFANILVREPHGQSAILLAIVLVAANDTGGLFAGMVFGKHKLAPSISPGKTWEGSGGSIALASIVAVLLLVNFSPLPWYWGIIVAVAIVFAGTCGDLFESKIKRTLGVKDMSQMIPGHGGFMDRLDSILFAIPAIFILYTIVIHLELLH